MKQRIAYGELKRVVFDSFSAGMTVEEICKKHGMAKDKVMRTKRKYKLDIPFNRVYEKSGIVKSAVVESEGKGMSAIDIALKYKVKVSSVLAQASKLRIKLPIQSSLYHAK